MDKLTIAVIIILLIVVGIFVGSQFGGSGSAVQAVSSYSGQIAGGGCGLG